MFMTRNIVLQLAMIAIAGVFLQNAFAATKLDKTQAEKLAAEAYIYAYPLMTADKSRAVMTNVETPSSIRAPMGQFANLQSYPDASFKDVTTPNADTLYSSAWVNVSKEPYVLHVPDEKGRYYLMPRLDGWTTVFAAPGTRTTGTAAHDFLIAGPAWHGKAPKGMKVYKSATGLVWVLGRTYSTGTAEDYAAVHAIQNQYSLTPLSSFGKNYTPPQGAIDSNIDMTTPVRDQVNAMSADQYYKQFAALMKTNPPTKADTPMVKKLAQLGIIPGKDFDMSSVDPVVAAALQKSTSTGLKQIEASLKTNTKIVNGWDIPKMTGTYGTNYLNRAFVTFFGFGANLSQDAIYPSAAVDKAGQDLNGKNNYVLHFAKGKLPPVKGFWSLTMYNKELFFVANPLNKYTVSERNNLVKNKDGSVDLYIQHDSPGHDKEANWLPAPDEDFTVTLRMYWPDAAVVKGSWLPPAVMLVNKSN